MEDNELGETSTGNAVALAGMMLLLGLGAGAAMYWSFAPGEVVRRQRVNSARRYLNATRATAQKMVDDARTLLTRVKRGDPISVPVKAPKCVGTARMRSNHTTAHDADADDDDE